MRLLKIVWNDELGVAIRPVEILIGTDDGPDFRGVASVPRLDETSTPNTWHFTQARAVAPPGTVSVNLFALFVDQTEVGTAYFDDLVGTMITEEALLGDYNNNDVVDAADYTVCATIWGRISLCRTAIPPIPGTFRATTTTSGRKTSA